MIRSVENGKTGAVIYSANLKPFVVYQKRVFSLFKSYFHDIFRVNSCQRVTIACVDSNFLFLLLIRACR